MSNLLNSNEVVTPDQSEADVAKEAGLTLAPHVTRDGPLRLQVADGPSAKELIIPPSVARLLLGILTEVGRGNAVAVAPLQAELTTNQAAELLNVSRPYLTRLLDDGVIPFRMVGTHHRMRLEDVLTYKKQLFEKRHAALDELSEFDQKLGLS